MRKVLYIFICIVFAAQAEITIAQIEEMVKKIQLKRPGVDLNTLKHTQDPFVKMLQENNATNTAPTPKVEEKRFALHAILNARAFINDKWYKLGDTIQGFTIKGIGTESVILQSGNLTKTLLLHQRQKSLIKFEAEGEHEKEWE